MHGKGDHPTGAAPAGSRLARPHVKANICDERTSYGYLRTPELSHFIADKL